MPQASIFVLSILVLLMLFTMIKILKYRKNHFWISSLVGSILFAFFFTISSVFWTNDTAYDRETLQHLEFGWPIAFEVQSQEMYDPPFPYEMNFAWGAYHDLESGNFYLSLFINLLGVLLIWISISAYLRSRNIKR